MLNIVDMFGRSLSFLIVNRMQATNRELLQTKTFARHQLLRQIGLIYKMSHNLSILSLSHVLCCSTLNILNSKRKFILGQQIQACLK